MTAPAEEHGADGGNGQMGWYGVDGQRKESDSGPWTDIRRTFIDTGPPGLSREGEAWQLQRKVTCTTPKSD